MLRAAIAPIVSQQHRRKIYVAASMAGTATAAFWTRSESAACSPSSLDDGQASSVAAVAASQSLTASFPSLSLSNVLRDAEQCRSLILPTAEALIRAARLAKTAVVMATDYQLYFVQRKQPNSLISDIYSWVFQCNNNQSKTDAAAGGNSSYSGELGRKQAQLEDQIDHLERDLDRAQQEYVAPISSSNNDEAKMSDHTLVKLNQKEAMRETASQLGTAQEELASVVAEIRDESGNNPDGIHERNAHRLLELCRTNGGVYIKVGQHLANLDLLVPQEYIQTLSSLFDNAPVSSYENVCHVVKQELGSLPGDLFCDFSETPLASASLAQVHTATCKETGKKLAIKVQHRGLRETSKGDLFAMTCVVGVAEKLFDDFNFGWICEEMTPQLPKELDFSNEGKNAEAAAAHLNQSGLDCVVPRVHWSNTTERVLTMDFEEGFRATDVASIEKAGLCRREVARLISSVFNAQIFGPGFVHCDPHEANVLLREHPEKKGKPQIVLVDHGLYKQLDDEFQHAYARLWTGIVMADVSEIKSACEQLGVTKMYPLLSSMLTSRPFDEVMERSQTGSLDAAPTGGGDKAVIRGYAQRYLKEIITMLDVVPRQMLLIFKMNDCLRHVDTALGSPVNNLVVAGKYASKRVYESDKRKQQQSNAGFLGFLRSWLSYVHVLIRISSYELTTRLNITQ